MLNNNMSRNLMNKSLEDVDLSENDAMMNNLNRNSAQSSITSSSSLSSTNTESRMHSASSLNSLYSNGSIGIKASDISNFDGMTSSPTKGITNQVSIATNNISNITTNTTNSSKLSNSANMTNLPSITRQAKLRNSNTASRVFSSGENKAIVANDVNSSTNNIVDNSQNDPTYVNNEDELLAESRDSIHTEDITLGEDGAEDISLACDMSQSERSNIEISDGLYSYADDNRNTEYRTQSRGMASFQNHRDYARPYHVSQDVASNQDMNMTIEDEEKFNSDCFYFESYRVNPFALFFTLDFAMAPFTFIILLIVQTQTHILLFLLVLFQCVSSIFSAFFLFPTAILIMTHSRFRKLQYLWTFPAAMILVGRFVILSVIQGFWFDWRYGRGESYGLLILIAFLIYGIANCVCILLIFLRCVFVVTQRIIRFQRQTVDPEQEENPNQIHIQEEKNESESEDSSILSPFANSGRHAPSTRHIEDTSNPYTFETNLGEDIESQFYL